MIKNMHKKIAESIADVSLDVQYIKYSYKCFYILDMWCKMVVNTQQIFMYNYARVELYSNESIKVKMVCTFFIIKLFLSRPL